MCTQYCDVFIYVVHDVFIFRPGIFDAASLYMNQKDGILKSVIIQFLALQSLCDSSED